MQDQNGITHDTTQIYNKIQQPFLKIERFEISHGCIQYPYFTLYKIKQLTATLL